MFHFQIMLPEVAAQGTHAINVRQSNLPPLADISSAEDSWNETVDCSNKHANTRLSK